jgi:hypothetical protein
MIDSHLRGLFAAVLTFHIIAPENVFPRQLDAFIWHSDICLQSDNARKWEGMINSANKAVFLLGYDFGLHKQQQNHCLFGRAYRDRFVALIEYQNASVESAVGVMAAGLGSH